MTVKHECSERVWNDTRRIWQACSRNATVQRDGQWRCWQHDPEYIKAKEETRQLQRLTREKCIRRNYYRNARNARLAALVTVEVAELLEQLALHVPYTLHTGIGIATQALALAARIREALEVNDEG